ncbi:MAG: hypothetical protein VKI82_01060 [Leptolyngbya sp.]|nr:hypothetical protein [Leptolyngbya sp.]
MVDSSVPPLRLQLDLAPNQPGLLEGLEAWVQLGLLSEAQVLAIAQTQLTCTLPPIADTAPAVDPTAEPDSVALEVSAEVSASTGGTGAVTAALSPPPLEADAEEALFRALPPPPSPPRRDASATGVWLNRLMSELSVVWLLGLGVFLVVLSSAVLAATQWARFNALGQYLVLLAYTLAFWLGGLLCGRGANLQLTAKTLGMITLLLVPLNFWAMDGLGVWGISGGFGLGLVATVILSWVAVKELRHRGGSALEQGNTLGLAYLHTGWGLAGNPLLAVYLSVLGSAAVTLHRHRNRDPQPPTLGEASDPTLPLGNPPHPACFPWPTLTIEISLGLLLLRALTQVPQSQWGQFGLAFGIYAATWVWLGQRHLAPASVSQNVAPDPPIPEGSLPPSPHPLPRWSMILGRLLLLWSWLLTISDGLAQAFGISALGLGLRLQALQRLGKRRDLLVAYAIAVQLGWVSWRWLPVDLRRAMVDAAVLGLGPVGWPTALLGISLFPYVVGLVALGDWFHRHNRPQLGRFSDALALGSNLLLTLVSLSVGRVLVVNLIASTVTAFVLAGRRTPRRQRQILLSYGLAIATLMVTLGQRWPHWPLTHWLSVMATLAVLAILGSKVLPNLWGKSAWIYGIGLSTATYGLLWWSLLGHPTRLQSLWTLVGLTIPVTVALVGRTKASVLTTPLAVLLTLGMPHTRLISLATATVLSAFHSARLRRPPIPFLTITYGLGLIVAIVDYGIPAFPRHWADGHGLAAALTLILWTAWYALPVVAPWLPAAPRIVMLYRRACDRWGHLLTLGTLTAMTLYPHGLLANGMVPQASPRVVPIVGIVAILLALALRYGKRVQPEAVYLAGWAGQLGVAEAMAGQWGRPLALAVPTLGLGAVSLALATGLRGRSPLVLPLHRLTLAYAGLALVLRSDTATAWTGWLVLGASLMILEVGRQGRQPLARWVGLLGLSLGWYELVLYQILQAPQGAVADGLMVLAAVAALIMGVYRFMAGRLQRWPLPPDELRWAAHLHWLTGSGLMLGAGVGLATAGSTGEPASLAGLGVVVAALLVIYALEQGRGSPQGDRHSAWVYGGLIEGVGWFGLVRLANPGLAVLDNWWGVVACAVAVPLYGISWSTWGWPQRPWRVMAAIMPLTLVLLSQGLYHIPTLWVLAGFYGWLAWHSGQIRGSYLSAGLAVWAVEIWLDQRTIQDPVLHGLPLSLALLYIAQIDPDLRAATGKTTRHWLRMAGISLPLVTALVTPQWTGWPVGILSLGILALGLGLRIRAFLYVGTLVFALNALNQLVLLNAAYPLMKWVLGLAVGVALIWVAATFERRRSQWLQITQNWLDNLDGWP